MEPMTLQTQTADSLPSRSDGSVLYLQAGGWTGNNQTIDYRLTLAMYNSGWTDSKKEAAYGRQDINQEHKEVTPNLVTPEFLPPAASFSMTNGGTRWEVLAVELDPSRDRQSDRNE